MITTCPHCGTRNRIDESRARTERPLCGKCKSPLPLTDPTATTPTHPVTLTDATLDRFLQDAGDKPVLVDCWAAWCGPCRMLAPTIDALAAESAGKYLVAKLDTDANPQTAARFNISGIPALLISNTPNSSTTSSASNPNRLSPPHWPKPDPRQPLSASAPHVPHAVTAQEDHAGAECRDASHFA